MRTLAFGAILLLAILAESEPLAAQDNPHDQYLNYMPLE